MSSRIKIGSLLMFFSVLLSASLSAKNLLPNGSFEVGLGKWIGWDNGYRNNVVVPEKYCEISLSKTGLISRENPRIGKQCLALNYPGFIQSQFIKLDKTKKYTISLYAKSDTGIEGVSFYLQSSYRTGEGYGNVLFSASGKGTGSHGTVGKEWQRFQVTTSLPESRNGYYKLHITHWDSGDGILYLDAIQIEEGEVASDYQPAALAEAAITTGREQSSNLFFTDEEVPVQTRICVCEKDAKSVDLIYTLYDYRGKKIQEFSRPVTLDSEGYADDNFPLKSDRKGLMSLIVAVKSGDKLLTEGELVFGMVSHPIPPSAKGDDTSPLGTHVMKKWQINLAEKLGFRWQRNLDFYERDGSLIWNEVEPEQGKFVFKDAGIDRYREHNFHIMGVLLYPPKWAAVHPDDIKTGRVTHLPNLEMWRKYVHETVTHFKGRVDAWEIWNEPQSTWHDTPENYFQLLKAAYEEAKQADPNCKIVGGCLYGGIGSFMNRLFGSGGLKYMDVLSMHASVGYMTPTGPTLPEEGVLDGKSVSRVFRAITDLMRGYGEIKPIWNTETDDWCQPFSRLYPFADDTPWNKEYPPLPNDLAADYLVQLTAVSLANNVPRSFLYYFGGGRYEEADSSQMLITGHMALKSTPVVAAETLRQFNRAKFYKELNWGEVARCYLFETRESPLAVVWGLWGWRQAGQLSLSSKATGFTYLDVMGNPREDVEKTKTGVVLTLDSQPVYIRARRMADLEKALSEAKITGLIPSAAGKVLAKEPALQKELNYAGDAEPVKGLNFYVFERTAGSVAVIISGRDDTPVISVKKAVISKIRLIGENIDVSAKSGDLLKFEVERTPVVVESTGLPADKLLAELKQANISGLRPFNLEGVWPTMDKNQLNLTIGLQNIGEKEGDLALTVKSLPASLVLEKKSVTLSALKPGEQRQVQLVMSDNGKTEESYGNVELEVSGGADPMSFLRPINLAYSLKAKNPVIIDGDLSEWGPEGVFNLNRKEQVVIGQSLWKGESDLSARVRSRWDKDFLYLAIEVKDDFLGRRKEAMQLYDGTSVEVFLDGNQHDDLGVPLYNRDDFQFLFGPATPEYPEDLWGIAPNSGQSLIPGLKMKSGKAAGGYTMEIAIPRDIFEIDMLPGVLRAKFGAGLSIGISIAVNDRTAESEGRKSSIVWGGTVLNYRDVSKFGTLVLVP